MRKLFSTIVVASFLLACSNNGSGSQEKATSDTPQTKTAAKDTTKKSIPSEAVQQIGNTDVRINYHAPAVRGRAIWGGLVAYDAVWVTGAHKATTLQVGKDFIVGGKTIPAGKYALFTIPGKDEWTVIINKNWNQHLADDYSEAEDVVRIKVKPQMEPALVERLRYVIEPAGESKAMISVSWEKLKLAFPLEVL